MVRGFAGDLGFVGDGGAEAECRDARLGEGEEEVGWGFAVRIEAGAIVEG